MFRTTRRLLVAMASPLGVLSLVAAADRLQAQPTPKTNPAAKPAPAPIHAPTRPVTVHPRTILSTQSSFTGVLVRPNNGVGSQMGAASQISSGYLGNNGGNFFNPMNSFNPTNTAGFNSTPMLYGFNAYVMNPYANPNNLSPYNPNPNLNFNGANFNGMNFNGMNFNGVNFNGMNVNALGVPGWNGINLNVNGFVPGATFVGNGFNFNGNFNNNFRGNLGINGL